MCGRFDVDARNPVIDELLKKMPPTSESVKTGQVFPGNRAMAMGREGNDARVRGFMWGFPKKDSKSLIINARAETALQKFMFANALKSSPVAIPVTGFFEWRANPELNAKEKFLFTIPDNKMFYLAGFSRFFRDDPEERFVILTTKANSSMEAYHHRMPVILSQNEVNPWLAGENLGYYLDRVQAKLQASNA